VTNGACSGTGRPRHRPRARFYRLHRSMRRSAGESDAPAPRVRLLGCLRLLPAGAVLPAIALTALVASTGCFATRFAFHLVFTNLLAGTTHRRSLTNANGVPRPRVRASPQMPGVRGTAQLIPRAALARLLSRGGGTAERNQNGAPAMTIPGHAPPPAHPPVRMIHHRVP
jgi:hypothetical protein